MMAAVATSSDCMQRLLFRVGAHTLAVDVCDDLSLTVLESTYAPLRCESVRAPHCTAEMRRLSDARLNIRFGRHALPAAVAYRSDVCSAYHAARELFVRCVSSQPGSIAFYGALVAVNDEGVLLLGPTAVGKSVLSVHMTEQGATFLGDETAILNLRSAEISALPRRPSLRESAIALLPDRVRRGVAGAKCTFQTESGRFWFALAEDELGFAPSSRSVPLRVVCIVRERDNAFSMRVLDVAEAIPLIVQRAYSRPTELAQLASLRHALRGVACYEVTLGKPDDSAAALLSRLAPCA